MIDTVRYLPLLTLWLQLWWLQLMPLLPPLNTLIPLTLHCVLKYYEIGVYFILISVIRNNTRKLCMSELINFIRYLYLSEDIRVNSIITDEVGCCLNKAHTRDTGYTNRRKDLNLNNKIWKVLSKVWLDAGTWPLYLIGMGFIIFSKHLVIKKNTNGKWLSENPHGNKKSSLMNIYRLGHLDLPMRWVVGLRIYVWDE